MKDSQALDYANHVMLSKITFLFVVTENFSQKNNDKSGSGLSTCVCELVLFNTENWILKNFVQLPQVCISWKEWRAGNNMQGMPMSCLRWMSTSQLCLKELALYSRQFQMASFDSIF